MGKDGKRSIGARLERHGIRVLKELRQRTGRRQARPLTVFVAGQQRSGTNMVMELLDRSFDTDVYHEYDPRAFELYEMRPPEVVQGLIEASGASHVVIKALCEADMVRSLLERFAPARAVWMLRDVDDTVASAVLSFGNFAKRMGRMSQDRQSDGWYGRGMSDETHALLRRHYHPEINEASAAAMMWYYRNVLFFEQGLDRDPRVLPVRYEELVQAPEQECRRICHFLDLPWSPWLVRRVRADSVRRRPPPPIEPSLRALCGALAQRFERVFAGGDPRPA